MREESFLFGTPSIYFWNLFSHGGEKGVHLWLRWGHYPVDRSCRSVFERSLFRWVKDVGQDGGEVRGLVCWSPLELERVEGVRG